MTMVLQLTGPISVGNVATEFGGTAPHSMSAEYATKIGKVAGAIIKLSDFRGKANAPTWVTGSALGTYAVAGTFSITLSATATGPVTYAVVTYPSPVFGSISGSTFFGTVPSGAYGTNVYSWTIAATSGGSTNRTFTMSVSSTAPVWSTSSIGAYYTNNGFNVALGVTSDSAVTVAIISSPGFGGISGKNIYGTTPSYGGTFYWTLRATDAENQIADASVYMQVYAPVAPGWSAQRSYNGISYIDCGYWSQGSYFYKNVGCDIGTAPIGYGVYNITIFSYNTAVPDVYGYINLNPGFYYFTVYAANASGSATENFGFTVY